MLRAIVKNGSICSTTVGLFVPNLSLGSLLHRGQVFGKILRLGRWHDLVVPPDADGFEVEKLIPPYSTIEHGTSLIKIRRRTGHKRAVVKAAVKTMISSGHTITAELDGTFYRKPAPDAPAYVGEGMRVAANQTIALVEVMKTFSFIKAPFSGILKRWLVNDGEAIKQGMPLFVIEPDPVSRHAS